MYVIEHNSDHELNSSSARTEENDTELPQTGDKNTFIESVLTALGTVSTALGLIVFRRKDKARERDTNK
ncbi:LPXTG cell wall anchor domain-containing protein [Ligilactobacillus faecis]|uniref:LPXTG cell wall anchor domain-containing protein n=1 Tax=Ligilactobacillus faecis TaxID=762833 RepID=A0ABV4DNL8_9LACO